MRKIKSNGCVFAGVRTHVRAQIHIHMQIDFIVPKLVLMARRFINYLYIYNTHIIY